MLITLTGIDEHTDIKNLIGALKNWRPNLPIEIGVLVSDTPEGRNRYPRESWIGVALAELKAGGVRAALHICGKAARAKLLAGHYQPWKTYVERIQVNGRIAVMDLDKICKLHPVNEIITQHGHSDNDILLTCFAGQDNQHSVLVDGSGGRGISPESWPSLDTPKRVGFAGGLGADNLYEHLIKLTPIVKQNFWIDMESKLRDEKDFFSIDKAWAALTSIAKFTNLFR